MAFILRTKRAQRKLFRKTELNLYFEEIIIVVEYRIHWMGTEWVRENYNWLLKNTGVK